MTRASGSGCSFVRTTNVSTFSLDVKTWFDACNHANTSPLEISEREIRWSIISVLNIDGGEITLEMEDRKYVGPEKIMFMRDGSSNGENSWKVCWQSLRQHRFLRTYIWILAATSLPKQRSPDISTPSPSSSYLIQSRTTNVTRPFLGAIPRAFFSPAYCICLAIIPRTRYPGNSNTRTDLLGRLQRRKLGRDRLC